MSYNNLLYFFCKTDDREELERHRDDKSLDWETTRAISFVYNSMFRKPVETSKILFQSVCNFDFRGFKVCWTESYFIENQSIQSTESFLQKQYFFYDHLQDLTLSVRVFEKLFQLNRL